MCAVQDIAVVPFLVLLPLVENDELMGQAGQSTMTLVTSLGPTALQTVFGLGVLLLGGRVVLRRIFELVRLHMPDHLGFDTRLTYRSLLGRPISAKDSCTVQNS